MAKAASKNAKVKDAKASAEAKNWTKVIKAVRSPKTGAYTFKEAIVHKDKVKDFLAENNWSDQEFIKKLSPFSGRLFVFCQVSNLYSSLHN